MLSIYEADDENIHEDDISKLGELIKKKESTTALICCNINNRAIYFKKKVY